MKKKGVVVEIAPRNKVIIMTAQGEFIKVPFKKHVHVGQEIRFTPKRERLTAWQMALAAALFFIIVGSWPLFTKKLVLFKAEPQFFVTVDLNSSLELGLSEEHRVLAAEALNDKGRDLLGRLGLVGQDLSLALRQIVIGAQEAGYLETAQNQVTVTIASSQQDGPVTLAELKDKRSGELGELESMITDAFKGIQLAEVRIWQVPLELQREAKAAGITPSRYVAINMPVQKVVPQRLEARLTMHEDSLELPKSAVSSLSPTRRSLAPRQWTQQNQAAGENFGVYKLSFPLVAQAKGDFRFNE
ncbi:MAG: anti-sigma factor domain-containing protein [Firmicutes bacterium]|nr:anti-sigma factor domain-containing protein [Bacillota bacterium]